MEYRSFGSSDLRVSAIGFGGWPMGGTHVVGGYGQTAEDEVIATVQRSLDLGITLFDTAYSYGLGYGEELLGRALGARRKDVVLVTKCGIYYNDATSKYDRDSRYQTVIGAAEASLRRLNTDHIDLFLIHWPDVATPFEEPMRAFSDLIAAGKIRYAGVSNFDSAQLGECLKTLHVATDQVGYNMFDRRREPDLFPYCLEHGVGVMAYGPLAHGLLTGTFTAQTAFDSKDWRAGGGIFGLPLMKGDNLLRNIEVVDRLKEVAAASGRSVAELAVAWVLRQQVVTVALVGARRPGEVEQNVKAVGWKLEPDELRRIDEILANAVGTTPE